MRLMPLFAIVVLLAACEQKPAEAPAPKVSQAPIAGEWIEADGGGETALVFRAPNTPDFVLVCSQPEKHVRVTTAFPAGGNATVFFGTQGYQGVLEPAQDEPGRSAIVLPANAALMQAIAGARSVQISAGDQFAETGQDKAGKLPAFATTCAGLTMPEGAPKAPSPN